MKVDGTRGIAFARGFTIDWFLSLIILLSPETIKWILYLFVFPHVSESHAFLGQWVVIGLHPVVSGCFLRVSWSKLITESLDGFILQ